MNRLLVILSTIVLAAVVVAGMVIALDRLPARAPATVTSASPDEQGYPPPPPPTPGPTGTPDANGYLPPPASVRYELTTLATSPYSDLLGLLQDAIDEGDAGPIARMVSDDRFLLKLFAIEQLDSEGGATLSSAGAQSLLDAYFAQGSAPRVQGYFATLSRDTGIACLNVLTHRYQGPVAFPTPEQADPHAPPAPETIAADAASWNLCRDQLGQWIWKEWVYGDYDSLVQTYALQHPDGGPYFVIRP